jgi:hypothetical protein
VPSLVFLAFASKNDQRFRGWATFRESIGSAKPVGDALPPASARRPADHGIVELASVGIWRLLASNNREPGSPTRASTRRATT